MPNLAFSVILNQIKKLQFLENCLPESNEDTKENWVGK
jgi:hypothetical protein